MDNKADDSELNKFNSGTLSSSGPMLNSGLDVGLSVHKQEKYFMRIGPFLGVGNKSM